MTKRQLKEYLTVIWITSAILSIVVSLGRIFDLVNPDPLIIWSWFLFNVAFFLFMRYWPD